MKKRLRARESRSDEVSDARLEDFAALSGLYEPPEELSPQQHLRIGTSDRLDQTVKRTLRQLARIQLEASETTT